MHDSALLLFLQGWHAMGVAAQRRAQPDMVSLVRGTSRTALKVLCELAYLQGFVGRDWQSAWEAMLRESNRGSIHGGAASESTEPGPQHQQQEPPPQVHSTAPGQPEESPSGRRQESSSQFRAVIVPSGGQQAKKRRKRRL